MQTKTLVLDDEEGPTKNHVMLKEFIKEQKREMRELRSNKLFQEFMQKAKADPAKKLKQEGETTKTPDEPGHALVATLDLIRNTAEKQKRKMHGVWSAFGQPYAPLGVPEVASKTLPPLNRDEINGIDPTAAPPQTSQATTKLNRTTSLGSRKETQRNSQSKQETTETPNLPNPEDNLLSWTVADELEVRFPREHLELAGLRERKIRSGGSWVDDAQAKLEQLYFEDEASTNVPPAGEVPRDDDSQASPRSDFSDTLPGGDNASPAPHAERRRSSTIEDEMDDWKLVPEDAGEEHSEKLERPYSSRSMMAQRAKEEATNPNPVKPPTMSMSALSSRKGGSKRGSKAPSVASTSSRGGGGSFSASLNGIDEEDGKSPVYRWRKEFLDVRQNKNQELYDALQARATRRAMAMKSPVYTQAVAKQLLEDMKMRGGKVSTMPLGGRLDSWQRAEIAMHAQDQPKKVDVSEIQAIERFYEKLCHLVERQRVSDPLSLSVVHKVKQLLEGGSNMHRSLLVAVCTHIQAIAQLGGANNPYIMPILHFIRQSVRVGAEELENMLVSMGLQGLIGQHRASRGTVTAAAPRPSSNATEPKSSAGDLEEEPEAAAGASSKALPNLE